MTPYLAHVVVDLPGGRPAELADAFMAVDAIVTVKILGTYAECRIDVEGGSREAAGRAAIDAAEATGLALRVTSVRLQTAAERTAALAIAMAR